MLRLTEHQVDMLEAVAAGKEFKTLVHDVELMLDRGLIEQKDFGTSADGEALYVMALTIKGDLELKAQRRYRK